MFHYAEQFAITLSRSPSAGDRRGARERLGFPTDRVAVIAMGQPYFFGGGANVLAKLILLRRFKEEIPGGVSAFLILTHEAASADRDMYQCRFPRNGNLVKIGLARNRFNAEVRLDAVRVTATDLNVWRDHVHALGWALPASVVDLFEAQNACTLATFNSEVLKLLASELGLAPDYWFDVTDTEWQVALSGFWSRLLKAWDQFVVDYNAKLSGETRPWQPGDVPVWCYDGGTTRHRLIRNGDRFCCPTTCTPLSEVPLTQLPKVFNTLGWRLGFRAAPRVLALSTLFDGQITGSGSRYNDVLYAMPHTLPLMPRFVCAEWVTERIRLLHGECPPACVHGIFFPLLGLVAEIGAPRLRTLLWDLTHEGVFR
jgi:hypothetical protein